MIFQAGLGLVRQSLATSCAETGLGNEARVSCSHKVASEPVASLLLAKERLETGETGTAVDRTGPGASPRKLLPPLLEAGDQLWTGVPVAAGSITHPNTTAPGIRMDPMGTEYRQQVMMGLMDLFVLVRTVRSNYLDIAGRSLRFMRCSSLRQSFQVPLSTAAPAAASLIQLLCTCITLIHHTSARTTYAPRHWYAVKPLPRWSLERLKHLSTRPNYLLL